MALRRAHLVLFAVLFLVASGLVPNPAQATVTPMVIPAWAGAQALSDAAAKSYSPQVAVSEDGTMATAVWYRNVGAKRVIESASATISDNQATWGPVSTISAEGLPLYPQVALSADGRTATAVWHFKPQIGSGITWIVQAASATITGNSADWGAAQDISEPGGDATFAQVALSANGATAMAMWNRKVTGDISYAQSATASVSGKSAAWNAPTNASGPGADANYPQFALSTDGTRATAVWTRKSLPDYRVQAASADINGTQTNWGPVSDLSAIGTDQASPQVAIAADGSQAHAVWSLADGAGTFTAQSSSATVNGNAGQWGGAVDLSAPSVTAQYPQVGSAGDGGRAWAVWDQDDGTGHVVQANTAAVAGNVPAWAAPAVLSGGGSDATTPQLAVSADGLRMTTVWSLPTDTQTIIQAASALLGDSLHWSAVSSLTTSGTALTPQVAAAADGGRATAVWQGWSDIYRVISSASATIAIPPGAPTNLRAVAGDQQLTVTFTAPANDGGAPILGYEYSLDGGGTWQPASPSPALIAQLVNGSAYQVLIRAVNSVGPGAAGATSGTPIGPALVPAFDQPVGTTTGFTVNMTNFDASWNITATMGTGSGTVTPGTPVGSVLPLTVRGMGFSAAATVAVTTNRAGYHPGSASVSGTSLPDPLGPNQGLADQVAGAPGTALVTVGGSVVPATMQRDDLAGTVILSGAGWQLVIQAVDVAGNPIPLKSGAMVLVPGTYLLVSAEGFAPGTPLRIWLFSTPVELGAVAVDSRGTLGTARIAVQSPIAAGSHVLQVNGYDASGTVRSTSLAVRVEPQVAAKLTATNHHSQLKLTVKPFCRSQYRVRLQRQRVTVTGGSDDPVTIRYWETLTGKHRTSGKKSSTWQANPPRGTYRAVVLGACYRAGATTQPVTLKR